MTCLALAPGPDGLCRNCSRPTSMASGRLEHKRGRWREPLGLPQVKPRVVTRPIAPTFRPRCADCDAPLQLIASAWRCPWTTSSRHRFEGADRIYCDWPYRRQAAA